MNALPRATQACTTAGDKAPAFPPNQTAPVVASNQGKKPLRLGLIIAISNDPGAAIAKIRDPGLPSCQVFVSDFDLKDAAGLRQALDQNKVEATSCVVGGPGREVWDFYSGPLTIGLVPRDTRAARVGHLKKASAFARQCGIPAVQTHCGFIPENPNDPLYKETVAAMREVAEHCKDNGQNFRYETGQETPITLVRAMRDVGLDNQGVNFDLANLILYGKANPVDAIESLAGMRTSLRNAKLWGADAVLLVPAVVNPQTSYREAWTRSQAQIRKLIPLAEEQKVVIAIEEVWNKFLLSPLEMVTYIDEFRSQWIKSWFDVGNVVLYGYPQDWIRTLGKRIVKVHLKDFKRKENGYAWVNLGEGDVDWRAVRQAFGEIGFSGSAVVELEPGDEAYLRDVSNRVDRLLLARA